MKNLQHISFFVLMVVFSSQGTSAQLSVQDRLDNRSFPAIFLSAALIFNLPASISANENAAYHDLMWAYAYSLKLTRTPSGIEIVGDQQNADYHTPGEDAMEVSRRSHEEIQSYNPNLIFVWGVPMRSVGLESRVYQDLFDEIPFLRTGEGQLISGNDPSASALIDFTDPKYIEMLVEIALAVDRSEFYDGIFLDIWDETATYLKGYRTLEEERFARITILQRIRAAVSSDFLILVNPNDNWRKAEGAAPYINGIYMETYRALSEDYNHNGLIGLEASLTWAEENLRKPHINALEGQGIGTESPMSPKNQQAMRCLTTLTLTHSNGFVVYTMGIEHEPHVHGAEFRMPWGANHLTDIHSGHGEDPLGVNHDHHHAHYWYSFWDADLGQPVSERGQLYDQTIEGLFIREFTNGWAVYNRSGRSQTFTLPTMATGVESNQRDTTHTVPDLDGEIYLKMPTLTADVNNDGVVNILDLVIVAGALGNPDGPDLNGDGTVNILDLILVAQRIGE